jgi:5-methylcytosine-specific restriction endonuclease McrA
MLSESRTLLLSIAFEPIEIVSWQRAISLQVRGAVEVLEEYDWVVRSPSITLEAPAVVRLLRSLRQRPNHVAFSRANIFARDGHRCQYCGQRLPSTELTFDHVVPRRDGGRTEWTNIVTACQPCNAKKGARTPARAGMALRKPPVEPRWLPPLRVAVSVQSMPAAWRDYVYWAGELDS